MSEPKRILPAPQSLPEIPVYAAVAPADGLRSQACVIRAGEKPRWGTPNPKWRKTQFIQAAIASEYPNGLPLAEPNHERLAKAVNARLQSDPVFRGKYGKAGVSRPAVIEALRVLRKANS